MRWSSAPGRYSGESKYHEYFLKPHVPDNLCLCDGCMHVGPCIWEPHSGKYLCSSCYAAPRDKFFGFYVGRDPGRRDSV